jgi:hypothetical protein
MREQWCCQKFKFYYEIGGYRGIGIRVGKNEREAPEFFLQFRAVNQNEQFTIVEKVQLVLVEETQFFHCPWCGRDPVVFYGKIYRNLINNDLIVDYPK